MTIQMVVPVGSNELIGQSGTLYQADANGIIQVNPEDVVGAMNGGFMLGSNSVGWQDFIAPVAAQATTIVASVSITNATLTIAAPLQYPAKLDVIVTHSSGTITAGGLTIAGTSNKGEGVTEVVDLAGAAAVTIPTSNAFADLESMVIAGIVGTHDMSLSVGNGAALGLAVSPGAVALNLFKELANGADEAGGTVDSTAGTVVPTTPADGTIGFSFGYVYVNAIG